MNKDSKIYVAGHNGLVGSEILKHLKKSGYENLITIDRKQLDLTKQIDTNIFMYDWRPEYIFLSAAKVGGIYANSTYSADFIYENLMLECNVIKYAQEYGVKKLLFLGSSCIYPRDCPQPIKEEYLLSSKLEPTNDGYAISKIAGIIMCQKFNNQYGTNFISIMPTNLYGSVNDSYDLKNSHVLPAMIKKIHDAKKNGTDKVELWGDGTPLREFLHVSDLAEASIFLMNNYNENEIINVGSGEEISIEKLAYLIKNIIGYEGQIYFNTEYPNGTPRKVLDSTKLYEMGWKPKIKLEDGITALYNELKNKHF